jgi:ABC-type transport system involved in multi-copper enzyme maturation permease subunit
MAPETAAPTFTPDMQAARPLPPAINAVYEVARKEVLQHVRTKRLLILGPIFLLVMVLVTLVFPLILLNNDTGFDLAQTARLAGTSIQNLAILFFFSGFLFLSGYFYLELIPILLTADAVCSEWSSRTIFLLLSKPVTRAQFVLGKFLGSIVAVGAMVLVLMLLDYVALQVFLPGASNGTDWARFLAALGVLLLGATAYTSVALFFSTLTRSAIVANIMAILTWMMGFPLLARIDYLIALGRYGIQKVTLDPAGHGVGWSQYLSPHDSMSAASRLLAPQLGSLGGSDISALFGAGTAHVGPAIVALLVHTALFLTLSLWVVKRRNFE